MVDAGRERDVLGPVIAAAARALQPLELRKARFPIAQHMGRPPDAPGKLADGAHRARPLAFRLAMIDNAPPPDQPPPTRLLLLCSAERRAGKRFFTTFLFM